MKALDCVHAFNYLLLIASVSCVNLNGYDLVYKPTSDLAPRALLVNSKNENIKSIATNAFTICLFTKLEDDDKNQFVDVFSFSSQETYEKYEIGLEINYNTQETNLLIHRTGTSFSAVPSLNEWAHICVSWEAKTGNVFLYVNGQQAGTNQNLGRNYEIGGDGYFVLGQAQNGYNEEFDPKYGVKGKLTKLNVWNQVLTQEEVKQVTSCELEGNVVSWSKSNWKLDDGIQRQDPEDVCGHIDPPAEVPQTSECCSSTEVLHNMEQLINTSKEFQTQMNQLSQKIVTIEGNDDVNEKEIKDLKTSYSEWNKEIIAMKQNIDANNQDISNLNNKTDYCEQDILKLREKSQICESDMASIKQKTESQSQESATLKQQFQENQEKMKTLKNEVDAWTKSHDYYYLSKRIEEFANENAEFKETTTKTINALQDELRKGTSTTSKGICPTQFTKVKEHCYYFSPPNSEMSWSEAATMCQFLSPKSHLLAIETGEEWNTVKNYISETKNLSGRTWWIGGSDQLQEGQWRWMGSNQPYYNPLFTFTAWCTGEPNNANGGENCTEMWTIANDVCWNDGVCNLKRNFICEAE